MRMHRKTALRLSISKVEQLTKRFERELEETKFAWKKAPSMYMYRELHVPVFPAT